MSTVRSRSCRRSFTGRLLELRQQRIELTGLVEGIEIVAAADMGRADEYLRKCAASVGARDHLLAFVPVGADVDLMKAYALTAEQFLGVEAIRAVANGIDIDSGHVSTYGSA